MTSVFKDLTSDIVDRLWQRDRKGEETYGKQLETFDGRDTAQDLEEEILDALVYCRKARLELEQAKEDIERMLDWSRRVSRRIFLTTEESDVFPDIRDRWFPPAGAAQPEPPKKPKVFKVEANRLVNTRVTIITVTLEDGTTVTNSIAGHDTIESALRWLAAPPTTYDWSLVL